MHIKRREEKEEEVEKQKEKEREEKQERVSTTSVHKARELPSP